MISGKWVGKGRVACAALIACATLLAGGCSNPTATQSNEDTSAAGYWPDQSTDLSGVNLTMWVSPNSKNLFEDVVASFNKKTGANLKISVVADVYVNNAQTKIATGDVPDLGVWQPTSSMLSGLVAQGKVQKLDNAPFIKNYKEGYADAAGMYKGARYSLLFTAPSVLGVYYNKEVFEKAGIKEMPQNWDELLETAQTIKNNLPEGTNSPFYDMGGAQWGTQWAVQVQLAEAARDGLWDRVNTGKEKFTDSTIMGAITEYQSMINDLHLFNEDIGSATDVTEEQALLNGETAMIFGNLSLFLGVSAMANNDKATLDKKIGFFPISKEGTIATVVPEETNGLVAFKTGDSKREAASRQFLTYLMGDAYQDFINSQNTTSILTTAQTPDTVPQALIDANDSIKNSVGSMQSLAIANPDFYVNLASMVNGTMTAQQAAQTTQDQFDEIAKAQGAEGF
ncbi:extracellular solute-binding protein [Bifidobacterium imperatoris]|uniref:Extracellular solute-binding protein n=1 Tax=Bifidobacterium imperatoris TaxID=2020965 RepID=A0A2N5IPH7_9BIFI|nr:extracellular solute-binding protein [Bifidobacterium imperatoris]PLS23865.1 sugar-binding protein [Bifidobacterium imperatoris]QSY58244.1 extracellular solute-binding protein [Bifidobacterium imperatoris]